MLKFAVEIMPISYNPEETVATFQPFQE